MVLGGSGMVLVGLECVRSGIEGGEWFRGGPGWFGGVFVLVLVVWS